VYTNSKGESLAIPRDNKYFDLMNGQVDFGDGLVKKGSPAEANIELFREAIKQDPERFIELAKRHPKLFEGKDGLYHIVYLEFNVYEMSSFDIVIGGSDEDVYDFVVNELQSEGSYGLFKDINDIYKDIAK